MEDDQNARIWKVIKAVSPARKAIKTKLTRMRAGDSQSKFAAYSKY